MLISPPLLLNVASFSNAQEAFKHFVPHFICHISKKTNICHIYSFFPHMTFTDFILVPHCAEHENQYVKQTAVCVLSHFTGMIMACEGSRIYFLSACKWQTSSSYLWEECLLSLSSHIFKGKKKTIHGETGSFQWGSERHVLFLKRQQGCCGVDDLIAAALDALMTAINAK